MDSAAPRIGDRDRGHQRLRVGVTRVLEHRWLRTDLDQTSQIHDPNEVRYAFDDRDIVADEEEGQPQVGLQTCEEIQNLRLHRDVERGNRLVGYDEARMGRDRARNRNALPLSSGQFVRILVEETAREIHAVEELRHAIRYFRF